MKILVFYRDSNPYQALLYKSLSKNEKDIVHAKYSHYFPLIGALPFLFTALICRLQGFKLLHVHWPFFSVRKPIPFHKKISFWLFGLSVCWSKILGYRIVWTVHNVMPHEPQTSNDLELMRFFSHKVNAKIVHSRYTVEQMKNHGLDISNTTIIPHGNYIGVYPDAISRSDAREKLGIEEKEFVVLFFGQLRSYKGVDDLLAAFESLRNENVRLVIAGKSTEPKLQQHIAGAQKNCKIDFYNRYISNDEVAIYFKAADVVCLPFKSITTSGSALLALSFGAPIIAPRVGALRDLPDNVGYLYDPKKKNALLESLQLAIKNKAKLKKLGENAHAYAETLSWDKIAEQTYKVYQEVLNERANENS